MSKICSKSDAMTDKEPEVSSNAEPDFYKQATALFQSYRGKTGGVPYDAKYLQELISDLARRMYELGKQYGLDIAATKVNEIHTWDLWLNSSIKKEVLRAAIQEILDLKPKTPAVQEGEKK